MNLTGVILKSEENVATVRQVLYEISQNRDTSEKVWTDICAVVTKHIVCLFVISGGYVDYFKNPK
jgi:hypothetical protein